MASVLGDKDVDWLQEQSDRIIESTSKYYDARLYPQGRQFNQSDAENLFHDVLSRIDRIKNASFKITYHYMGDLLRFINSRAVNNFKVLNAKKACHDLFLTKMGKANASTDKQ